MEAKTITMAPNGQVVIPKEFRDALRVRGRVRFLAVREGDHIVLKPLERLEALEEFRTLAATVRKRIQDAEITVADLFEKDEAERLGLQ